MFPVNSAFLISLLLGVGLREGGWRREGENIACLSVSSKISESTKNKYQPNQYEVNELRNHARSQQKELTVHSLKVNPVIVFLIAHCIPEQLIHKKMWCWSKYIILQIVLFA